MTDVQFAIHQATHTFGKEPIHFQVVQMKDSALVWIGKADAKMGDDFSLAMHPRPGQNQTSVTQLLGQKVSNKSSDIAKRFAAKYNQPFYVTLGLPEDDDMLAFAERKLKELLTPIVPCK